MKIWNGEPKCDFSELEAPCTCMDEFVDGKTVLGPWAIMCPLHFRLYGVGLGLGLGQKYIKEGDVWILVEEV